MKTESGQSVGIAGRRVALLALIVCGLVLVPFSRALANGGQALGAQRPFVGTWYLALEAGPFAPVFDGLVLSGVMQIHGDRTFMLNDAGDFAADSFSPMPTFATAQYGAWERVPGRDSRGARVIRGTTLFLEAAKPSGEAVGWSKVVFEIRAVSNDRLEGTINAFFLPCTNACRCRRH